MMIFLLPEPTLLPDSLCRIKKMLKTNLKRLTSYLFRAIYRTTKLKKSI